MSAIKTRLTKADRVRALTEFRDNALCTANLQFRRALAAGVPLHEAFASYEERLQEAFYRLLDGLHVTYERPSKVGPFDDITIDDPFADEERLVQERRFPGQEEEMEGQLEQMLDRLQSRITGTHPAFGSLFG
jgi:hypothetical protein